jgi:diadenosine tetraphosphate (Ap4A) HIT family hydrolase
MFELHPQLQADTVILGRFELSMVLLHKDSNYPWLLLVPQRNSVTEIHHLGEGERVQLMRESCRLSEMMTDLFNPVKMNVAALGNVVPQLHVHHVARFDTDAAWPKPIWGIADLKFYSQAELTALVDRLRNALASDDFEVIDSADGISGVATDAGEVIF